MWLWLCVALDACLVDLSLVRPQILYVQQFTRPTFISEMQARKFGMRHLQLIERQYHAVIERDDAIAVRGQLPGWPWCSPRSRRVW